MNRIDRITSYVTAALMFVFGILCGHTWAEDHYRAALQACVEGQVGEVMREVMKQGDQ